MKTNVPDNEIEKSFAGTRPNYGPTANRAILEQGVLKTQGGGRPGHTLGKIMRGLGLISLNNVITKKGREFLFAAFYEG